MRALDRPGRSPVHARRAMAATSHTDATQVALDILKAGGNALDAAIAACAMQCVVEPGSTGIGGDCFCLYKPAGQATPLAFNGSGRAPAGATVDALAALGVTTLERGSPHSVIVPGAVDAWTRLHADHGRVPFAELMAPAVKAAREGFVVSSRVAFDIDRQAEYLADHPRAAGTFLVNGAAPAVGSVLFQRELADALELIGREGRDAFYRGELAEGIVEELQRLGGLHTMDDLAAVAGDYVTPISTEYRGLTLHECPPNGQGVIALMMMNMMREAPLDAEAGPLTAERIHLEIEACRQAYRVRDAHLADPDQVDVPVDAMLDPAFARELLAAIDPARASVPPPVVPLPPHRDTVYISVVDEQRNVCSFINTLYWPFGGGITTRHGIVLTNRGQGFSLDPDSPNVIAPGKRPKHTIIPAIATRGDDAELCFGVMGGEYQAMGQMQFLTRYLDFGLDIQESMDFPRFMADPDTGDLEVESGIDAATRQLLTDMGHNVSVAEVPIGGSQAIAINPETGVLSGGSDPRKDGCAAGY